MREAGLNRPCIFGAGCITETIMTVQALSSSIFAPTAEARPPSFWWGLFDAIVEERQCKSDGLVTDYLRRHEGEHDALERRPSGRW
jgi:hypothetical protein